MVDTDSLLADALQAIGVAKEEATLDALRVQYLGKKGSFTALLKSLGELPPEKRPAAGEEINAAKTELQSALELRKVALVRDSLDAKLSSEKIDITLPGRRQNFGGLHPISITIDRITDIFQSAGYDVAVGPEIEDDYHNFEALNIPAHHPARAMHDTFYVNPGTVLRTHTSPVQVRVMEGSEAPFKMVCPGRVYRCDSDLTHTPMFHQVEGLALDTDISMANLKWCLEEFVKAFFEVDDVELRFRASHFPFTEPSAEVDIRCSWADGQLKVGEGDDWLEILGSGMVHPKVLAAGGIDAAKYQGFAFGMGIDRIAML